MVGNPEVMLIVGVLVTALLMFCWRGVIKLLLALVATGIVLAITCAVLVIYQGLHTVT